MLKISNVTHHFGKQKVLDAFSLETQSSGLYVFAGANGSGKSTLFNCIGGFIHPEAGEISLNECKLPDLYRAQMGISMEPFKTEPHLTVGQILEIARVQKQVHQDAIQYWLNWWELIDAVNKKFKALSVGMCKRLSIITSLLGDPQILLWDEPFNGLDPVGMEKLRQLITEQLSKGKLILCSTHILGELGNDPAQIIIMENGRLVRQVERSQLSSMNEDEKRSIVHLFAPAITIPT